MVCAEAIVSLLRKQGERLTIQRRAVIEYLKTL